MELLLDLASEWLHRQPTIFDLIFWFEWMDWHDVAAAIGLLLTSTLGSAVRRLLVTIALALYRRFRRWRERRPQRELARAAAA